jgi:hypothetical protein
MKPGDLIRIYAHSHGYPLDYKRGEPVIRFSSDTTGIFLAESVENGDNPRTFYKVITDRGIISIFSGYTDEVK